MGVDYEVLAQIEVLLKGQADTQRRLDDLDRGAKKAESSMGKASAAVQRFGAYLAGALSAVAIGRFASQSVLAFAEIERRINATRLAMENLGLDASTNLPRIVAHLKAIEQEGGPALQDTLTAFQKMIGITKDVEAALFAVTVAANISEEGNISAASAAEALAAVLQGRAKEAAKSLGIQLVDLSGVEKTNAEILEEVFRKYEGFGDKLEDTQNLLDRNSAGWENAKRSVGEGVSFILQKLDSWHVNMGSIVAIIKTIGLAFNSAVLQIISGANVVGTALVDAFNIKLLLKSPQEYVDTLKSNFTRGLQDIGFANEETAKEFARIWDETNKAVTQSAEDAAKGRDALLQQARRKAEEEDKKAREKAAAEAKEAAQKIADEKERIERESADRLLAAQIQAAEDGSSERERLEIEALARIRDRAIAEAEKVGAGTAEIEEAFRIAKEALEDDYRTRRSEKEVQEAEDTERKRIEAIQAVLEARRAATPEDDPQAQADIEIEILREQLARQLEELTLSEGQRAKLIESTEAQIVAIRARAAKAAVAIDMQVKRDKIQLQQDIANAAFALAEGIFGQSKALAIAQALVNTYLAAAMALVSPPGPPLSFVYVALAIAQGLAQVANIRKQNFSKGKGFDDPIHDRLAYQGGRRWAEDWLRLTSSGFRAGLLAGLPSAAASSVTTNNSIRQGDMVVNVGALYGGDAGLRQLRRELDAAYRRDAARRVR